MRVTMCTVGDATSFPSAEGERCDERIVSFEKATTRLR